ncbi:hypothetical protein E2562_030363 [Oryza meyeriana var. granulata]|uniref:Uncharacterized protein n=1 Tax=Oryza meyeriana var. granulata TaxID=110450 RepID=A0A6G1DPL4_9ORYZ|nr:hypothetical protein E2562_030363 [Oryza meyeriana var. granulata]
MNLTSAVEGRWQANQERDAIENRPHVSSQDVSIGRPHEPNIGYGGHFLPATALFRHTAVATPALCCRRHVTVAALCSPATVAAPALCSPATVAAPSLYSRATVTAAVPALYSHIAVAAAATWIEDVMLQRGKLCLG